MSNSTRLGIGPVRRQQAVDLSVPDAELGAGPFDEFFGAELPGLVVLLTALTGSRAVAEELAQETMLRAHQRWSVISRYDAPGAWLRRVAMNLAHNSRARRRSERRAIERLTRETRPSGGTRSGPGGGTIDHSDPTGHLADDAGEFWAVVRSLPRNQSVAVLLHYLEDRSVADVAEVLGCAEATAKVHLFRGRAKLAQLLTTPEATDGTR